jgi:hypothetical protein
MLRFHRARSARMAGRSRALSLLCLATLAALALLASAVRADDAPAYHLVTYATPSHEAAAARLLQSAKRVGGFAGGRVYGPQDLDEGYRVRNAAILAAPRGAGYWIYKPYVILHYMLHNAEAGDIVCYMDSMYEFKALFTPWVQEWTQAAPHIGLTHNKPIEVQFLEKAWSKRDAFLLLGVNETAMRESNQAWCGFVAFPHTFMSVQFLAEWLTYTQDARIVTDAPSTLLLPETPDFIENRHDQTICSLLAKKWGVHMHDFPAGPVYNHHLLG